MAKKRRKWCQKGSKMEPKWVQNLMSFLIFFETAVFAKTSFFHWKNNGFWASRGHKFVENSIQNLSKNRVEKMMQKRLENDAEREPKWEPKWTKNQKNHQKKRFKNRCENWCKKGCQKGAARNFAVAPEQLQINKIPTEGNLLEDNLPVHNLLTRR